VADRPRVGLLVPNLFLRVPVESAVRGAGAEPVALAGPEAAAAGGVRVLVVDLEAVGRDPAAKVKEWVQAGVVVLGFGPHVDAARLSAARQAGAVVLPRAAFLGRLPELVASAMTTAGLRPRPAGGEDEAGDAGDN
jgi:hypothetical protein